MLVGARGACRRERRGFENLVVRSVAHAPTPACGPAAHAPTPACGPVAHAPTPACGPAAHALKPTCGSGSDSSSDGTVDATRAASSRLSPRPCRNSKRGASCCSTLIASSCIGDAQAAWVMPSSVEAWHRGVAQSMTQTF
eukprot:217533-Chlamydomonas_euryale.AAC.1